MDEKVDTRSFTHWLPPRAIVAWAVLGATAAIALMYSPAVFRGESLSGGCVRIIGQDVVNDVSLGDVDPKIVAQWHLSVTVCLGLIGGLLGWLIGRRIQASGRQASIFDFGLWVAVTALAFAFLAIAGLPGDERLRLSDKAKWVMSDLRDNVAVKSLAKDLKSCASGAAFNLVRAMIVGWAIATIAPSFGFRLPGRRLPPQAADYDDAVSKESGQRGTDGVPDELSRSPNRPAAT